MGFQARKSFKVMPGVRMTVSKGGVSTSAGVRGARVTRTASGRTTRTVGIPGSGISHTKTVGSKSTAAPAAPAPASLPKPGFTAPKWEKELYKAITAGKFDELPRIGQTYPQAAGVAAMLDGLVAMQNGESERALELCRFAWRHRGEIDEHPFVRKYLAAGQITLEIADGVSALLPMGRDALGMAVAELEQEAGNLSEAITVVEELDPSLIAAVSLGDLYIEAGRHEDVVELTNGMSNTDDPSALLLTFRGIALRELGHVTAAREAFKEALKSRSRDSAIRHRALVERAGAHLAESKPAMARKDLERVLAEDSAYPGVTEALASLEG